jgi:hypothetical protein
MNTVFPAVSVALFSGVNSFALTANTVMLTNVTRRSIASLPI